MNSKNKLTISKMGIYPHDNVDIYKFKQGNEELLINNKATIIHKVI